MSVLTGTMCDITGCSNTRPEGQRIYIKVGNGPNERWVDICDAHVWEIVSSHFDVSPKEERDDFLKALVKQTEEIDNKA